MRDHRLDYIRVIAIFLVILVHTWSLADIPEWRCAWLGGLYQLFSQCGVPLFFMISGALLLSKPIVSIKNFYTTRFKRLLVPFVLWSLITYTINICLHRYAEIHSLSQAFMQFIPYLLSNKINAAYWFVYVIALLYLLTPFLQKGLAGCSKRFAYIFIPCAMLLIALHDLYPCFIVNTYWSSLFIPLLYFIGGHLIYQHFRDLSKTAIVLMACGVVVGMGGCILHISSYPFWCVLECLSLFTLFNNLPMRPCLVVQAISSYTYAIYLIHILLVRPLYLILPFDGKTSPLGITAIVPLVMAIIVFVLCSAICFCITKCFKKTQFIGI